MISKSNIYEAPQSLIVEMQVEGAVLEGSGDPNTPGSDMKKDDNFVYNF